MTLGGLKDIVKPVHLAERSAHGVTWCLHGVQGGEHHGGHGQEDDQGCGWGSRVSHESRIATK